MVLRQWDALVAEAAPLVPTLQKLDLLEVAAAAVEAAALLTDRKPELQEDRASSLRSHAAVAVMLRHRMPMVQAPDQAAAAVLLPHRKPKLNRMPMVQAARLALLATPSTSRPPCNDLSNPPAAPLVRRPSLRLRWCEIAAPREHGF